MRIEYRFHAEIYVSSLGPGFQVGGRVHLFDCTFEKRYAAFGKKGAFWGLLEYAYRVNSLQM